MSAVTIGFIIYSLVASGLLIIMIHLWRALLKKNKLVEDSQKNLDFIAHHDYLTGIFNRKRFEELAKESLARASRYKKLMGILLVDLDRFKMVNDTMGHETGDLLLKEITKRFTATIREVDILARLGGDEFAVIADH